jgi:hypothetical protein
MGRQRIDDQAVPVHLARHDLRTVDLQRLAHRRIVRLLQQHLVARVEQHARGQRDRLLRAVDDHHVLRLGLDAATPRQVVAHRFAQRGQPLRRRIVGRGVRRRVGEFARPRAGQRGIGQRHAVLERVTHAGNRAARNAQMVEDDARAPGELRLRGQRHVHRVQRSRALQRRRHVTARADTAVDEPLRAQLFIRGQHRVARDAELARKLSCRRQASALADAAAEYRALERPGQLRMKRTATIELEVHAELPRRTMAEWPH